MAPPRHVIVAGGGIIYSEAAESLAAFCQATGIPVGETQATLRVAWALEF